MNEELDKIIADIKRKKEFASVDNKFVKKHLSKELARNKKLRIAVTEKDYKHLTRSKIYKQAIKDIRAKLRQVYGVFVSKGADKRKEVLEELSKILKKKSIDSRESMELHKKILDSHLSSKERFEHYEYIYEKIFKVTGEPQAILDLGCGMNPFSFPFMKLKKLQYFASDLNLADTEIIQEYFNILHSKNFTGLTKAIDLTKAKKEHLLIATLPKSDICFLLKLLESIERRGHKLAETLISTAPAKYVVASFPTRTISGKFMTRPERAWLERICLRYSWPFQKFAIENEIFYLIDKSKSIL